MKVFYINTTVNTGKRAIFWELSHKCYYDNTEKVLI